MNNEVTVIQEATKPAKTPKDKKEPKFTWKNLVQEVISENYNSGDSFKKSEIVALVSPVAKVKFPKNNNPTVQVGTNLTKLITDGVISRVERGVYQVR